MKAYKISLHLYYNDDDEWRPTDDTVPVLIVTVGKSLSDACNNAETGYTKLDETDIKEFQWRAKYAEEIEGIFIYPKK